MQLLRYDLNNNAGFVYLLKVYKFMQYTVFKITLFTLVT